MQKNYVIPIVALVLVVGGLAWVAQYLPNTKKETVRSDPAPTGKKLVAFTLVTAQWEKTPANESKDDKQKPELNSKYVETGDKGHYDFFFKNLYEQDIEAAYFTSDCDCTSVRACVLPNDEWDRLVKIQTEKPGEDLSYTSEPTWHDLAPASARNPRPFKGTALPIKSGERGVIRVSWLAKKGAGQKLNIAPHVHFQRPGDPTVWTRAQLVVPIKISQPVQFSPERIVVSALANGKSVTKFDAWSSTRTELKLNLDPTPADAHFVFEVREVNSKEKCAALEASLNLDTRVLCACEVTLTVYETKDGQQLAQGSFFHKWPITLDGQLQTELYGPEIVGRVRGEIQIGGADDQGRIRFRSFDLRIGGEKEVQLAADAPSELAAEALTREPFVVGVAGVVAPLAANAHMKLTIAGHAPSWIQVKLTSDKRKPGAAQRTWSLEVKVPANTIGARSFEEPDAVTLRIVGMPERFVRIPLDGQISGQ